MDWGWLIFGLGAGYAFGVVCGIGIAAKAWRVQ